VKKDENVTARSINENSSEGLNEKEYEEGNISKITHSNIKTEISVMGLKNNDLTSYFGVGKQKYMEFVEQSHQPITNFVYPSKICTNMPKNLEMLGLEKKEIQRRLKS